jgi:alpha-tubulin suppressor-like RCC1 family protein
MPIDLNVPSPARAMAARRLARLALASLCGVAACDSPVGPSTYTVGGTVSGLAGSGLVLVNDGGDELAVSANGPITFASALPNGAGYRITVLAQPTRPTQTCVVSGGSGTVTADVTTVAVACFLAGAASPVLVSSPVPGLSPTAVYVSLPPRAVPSGSTATITDLRTGGSANAAVVDGGFDPVALPAIEGDTLVVVVPATGGAGPKSFLSVVAASTAPRVVRTDPPPHQQDVSPMSVMVIVFSEPLDPATVDAGSIELRGGPTPVTGTVRFSDVAHLQAEFHPDDFLAQGTEYQLVLSQGIRDASGLALDSAVTVPFTTGTIRPPTNLVFASVSVGYSHTCAVTTAGDAYCWGEGPAVVAGGLSFAAVSAGWTHTCGLTAAGAAYCWGSNSYGQLGDGTTTGRSSPRLVAGGLSFAAVSAGDDYTCGVTAAGAAYCWGVNYAGQLGDGTTTDRASPALVTGGVSFAAVSAGDSHTCGLTDAGAAYCWGSNRFGNLGDGTTTDRATPRLVAGALSFAAVSANLFYTCGLTAAGAAYCWGSNEFGRLGDGTMTDRASPRLVAGGLNFTALSAGAQYTCAVTAAHAAYCWGYNGYGQLGDGTTTGRRTPTPVTGGVSFAAVSAGFYHTCGLTPLGAAYCWGDNRFGNLGDGPTPDSSVSSAPVKVAGQP